MSPQKYMKTRKPIRKQPASPSLTSLFSSITKTSNNSSGSNSTVTPESYAKQQRNGHEARDRRTPTGSPKLRTQPTPQPTPPASPVNAKPDVFAFMEDEEEDEESSGSDSEENEEEEEDSDEGDEEMNDEHEYGDDEEDHELDLPGAFGSIPIPNSPHQSSMRMDYVPRTPDNRRISTSLHSDSGISMRSSSPDHDSPLQQRKIAYFSRQTRDSSVSSNASHRPPRLTQLDLDSSPESFYTQLSRSVPQTATYNPIPPAYQSSQSLVRVTQEAKGKRSKQASHHSDLATSLSATSSSETAVRPIYCRFEALTNHLLLQLQSELQALEQDLNGLNASLSPPATPNTSRRTRRDAIMPEQRTQLEWQRADLYGLIARKLDQYHRALGSYHALNCVPAPEAENIEALKELVKTSPVDPSFLSRLEDLAILEARPQVAGASPLEAMMSGVPGDRESALFTGGAVLMTILAFKFVPRFIARLFLGLVIVSGMVGTGMLPEMKKEGWKRQASLYVASVAVLAAVVG